MKCPTPEELQTDADLYPALRALMLELGWDVARRAYAHPSVGEVIWFDDGDQEDDVGLQINVASSLRVSVLSFAQHIFTRWIEIPYPFDLREQVQRLQMINCKWFLDEEGLASFGQAFPECTRISPAVYRTIASETRDLQ